MILRYKILAQINLLHEYYHDGKCWSFNLIPSPVTENRLSELGLRFKIVGNQGLVLVKVNELGNPITLLAEDCRLVFYMEMNRPEFLTVSNVNLGDLKEKRFHFTNLTANVVGMGTAQALNLSHVIELFDNSRSYIPGEYTRIGTGIFECLKAGIGQLPTDPGSTFWISKGTHQNASRQDMVPILNMMGNFKLTVPAAVFRIRTYGLNPLTSSYDQLLRDEIKAGPEGEVSEEVQVDLSTMPSGRYKLDINGQFFEAYFDNEAKRRGVFAILELFNFLPKSDAFSFLDTTDKVREVTYSVRFGNRSAFWKYITPLHKVNTILLSSDHLQPSPFVAGSENPALPLQIDYFVSKTPLPLSEKPTENLFDLIIGSEARPAPKPDPRLPGLLSQNWDMGSSSYLDSICTIRLNH